MVIAGKEINGPKRDWSNQGTFRDSLKAEQREHFGFPPELTEAERERQRQNPRAYRSRGLPSYICAASLRGLNQIIVLPDGSTNQDKIPNPYDPQKKLCRLISHAHHKTPDAWAIKNSWPPAQLHAPSNGIILDIRVHDDIHMLAEEAIRRRATMKGIQIRHAWDFSKLNEDWVTPVTVAIVANYFEWITSNSENLRALNFKMPLPGSPHFLYAWESHLISKAIVQNHVFRSDGKPERRNFFIHDIYDIRLQRETEDSIVDLNLDYDMEYTYTTT